MPPERNPEACEVKEGIVDGEQMFVTNQQAAKLSDPGIGSFHNPSTIVATQFAAIFIAPSPVVLPVRRKEFDSALFEPLTQRIGIVAAVGYDAFWLLPRASFRPGVRGLLRRWLPQA
jgi:hypothetical protein